MTIVKKIRIGLVLAASVAFWEREALAIRACADCLDGGSAVASGPFSCDEHLERICQDGGGIVPGTFVCPCRADQGNADFWAFDLPGSQETLFVNENTSQADILVHQHLSNVWVVVPPGQSVHVNQFGMFGCNSCDVTLAMANPSPTQVAYKVTEAAEMERALTAAGPWTDIAVGDTLVSGMCYRRKTMNTSSIKVKNEATGETLEMPKMDIIFLITNHYVPDDPHFVSLDGRYFDAHFAAFHMNGDLMTASSTSADVPTYKVGLSSAWGEAFVPTVECRMYGDVAPPGGNGIVDVDDLICVLDCFAGGPLLCNGDIYPCGGGDLQCDVDDLISLLGAFAGNNACPCG